MGIANNSHLDHSSTNVQYNWMWLINTACKMNITDFSDPIMPDIV